ncbi:MAG: hydroxymethylbilane synthase [Chloroflexota bacterium]
MTDNHTSVTLGTRGSALARWQTNHISQLLQGVWPELTLQVEVFTTQGDRIVDRPLPLLGGKGLFTAELETALRSRTIDLAVHSLKDLPTENPPDLILGAIPEREAANDVLVSRNGYTLKSLPHGALIGTSSRRRAAQLLHRRPDIHALDIRGNVDTRIRKALDPATMFDAIILASAGIERLEQSAVISDVLPLDVVLPAPGQGALGVQCRNEAQSINLLAPINHNPTHITVTAERAFLAGLGGGCLLPIAAYAVIEGDTLRVRGRVNAVDGSTEVNVHLEGTADLETAEALGHELAQMALGRGVAALLENVR